MTRVALLAEFFTLGRDQLAAVRVDSDPYRRALLDIAVSRAEDVLATLTQLGAESPARRDSLAPPQGLGVATPGGPVDSGRGGEGPGSEPVRPGRFSLPLRPAVPRFESDPPMPLPPPSPGPPPPPVPPPPSAIPLGVGALYDPLIGARRAPTT
jgi:hypothetical protein